MWSKVILFGRLTRDPELQQSIAGKPYVTFTLAVERYAGPSAGKVTAFVDVTGFGARGEALAKNLAKGDPVLVEGQLDMSKWTDKDTGRSRSKLGVIMDQFTFVPRASDGAPKQEGVPF